VFVASFTALTNSSNLQNENYRKKWRAVVGEQRQGFVASGRESKRAEGTRGREEGVGSGHRGWAGIALWVKVNCPRAVDDPAIDVGAKVNLADVVVLKHCLVTLVRGPVGGTVIERHTSRERQSPMQTIFTDQLPTHEFRKVRGKLAMMRHMGIYEMYIG
jgi:hypothetical protein